MVNRRDFLVMAWGAVGSALAAGMGFIGLRFLTSRAIDSEGGGIVEAGSVDDYAPDTVTAFLDGQFYLVRLADGGYLALYRKCTHLNCVINWQRGAGEFNCPCHGSRFEVDGAVINPPAPRPLLRYPITIEDGRLLVDTGTLIERDRVHDNDAVYPEVT